MVKKKKPFNPPAKLYVLFDTESGHVLDSIISKRDLDAAVEGYPLADTESVVEYVLPTKPQPKSRRI